MKKKHVQLTFVLLAALSGFSFAGGPTYSRFGLGDLLFIGGSRITALGGAGIGLLGDQFINRYNPAGLARISLTRISGSFDYSKVSSVDNSGSSDFARGDFAGLAFAIPISKDAGVVWLMESTPYSRVNYAVERSDNQAGVQSRQLYVGSGGLSTLSTALSWTMVDRFTAGLKFHYLYGRVRQMAHVDFSDPTFIDSDISRSTFHSGFYFTAGFIYEGVSDLLSAPSLQGLNLGGIITSPTKLSSQDEEILTTAQSFDTTRTGSANFDVPLGGGIGFSYTIANRYLVTGDYYMQQWASTNLPKPGTAEFKNSSRFGLGVEMLPERDQSSYFRRVAYRLGFSYHSSYLKMNGNSIDEYFITGGVGLPVASDARINVGLHWGFRGTTANNLQRDTIFKLSLSLSASEAWFIQIEEE